MDSHKTDNATLHMSNSCCAVCVQCYNSDHVCDCKNGTRTAGVSEATVHITRGKEARSHPRGFASLEIFQNRHCIFRREILVVDVGEAIAALGVICYSDHGSVHTRTHALHLTESEVAILHQNLRLRASCFISLCAGHFSKPDCIASAELISSRADTTARMVWRDILYQI